MCDRFSFVTTSEEFERHFHLRLKVTVAPRYNIAPSQQVIIIQSGVNGTPLHRPGWD
jgi:putative SOS response-associated peptidase YedK